MKKCTNGVVAIYLGGKEEGSDFTYVGVYMELLLSLSACMSQQLKAHKSTTPRTALSFQRKEEELP